MKNTLEELRLAQAKGCRIEYLCFDGDWRPLVDGNPGYYHTLTNCVVRIHPADEWKARLPRLKEGAEWACDGFTYADGERPLILGEVGSYQRLHYGEWREGVCCGVPEEKDGVFRKTTRPVPPEFLHPDEIAKQPEAAPQTDTPITDANVGLTTKEGCETVAPGVCQILERRAIAAEARLAKWESELSKVMPQDFKDWWQNSREEWPEVARMVTEGLRKQVEMTDKAAEARVKELESALRLRPIAEAGPVPEGAVRIYGQYSLKFGWTTSRLKCSSDTHFIDIYPPQQ